MSKVRAFVAGAMLIGAVAATPTAQARMIGAEVFGDIPVPAATHVIKYAVSWWSRLSDWLYWFYPTQPTQPPRP